MALFDYPALAIDTSMNACSVAVQVADGQVHTKSLSMPRGHAEALLPLIISLCEEAKTPLKDIQTFIVTRGPGAFAGLRVGLATAVTLARAAGKPVYAVETPSILAFEYGGDAPVCVVMESKRKDFYVQYFDASGQAEGTPFCAHGNDIAESQGYTLIGDGVDRFSAHHPNWAGKAHIMTHPDPAKMFQYCNTHNTLEKFTDISPLYCREADVSSPKLTITME